MLAKEAARDASALIGQMVSDFEDGDHALTALLHEGQGEGLYASSEVRCEGEDVHYERISLAAVMTAAGMAMRSVEGGVFFASRCGPERGVPLVRGWHILASTFIPMSAEELRRLHVEELGGTPVLPLAIGCQDAYPIEP